MLTFGIPSYRDGFLWRFNYVEQYPSIYHEIKLTFRRSVMKKIFVCKNIPLYIRKLKWHKSTPFLHIFYFRQYSAKSPSIYQEICMAHFRGDLKYFYLFIIINILSIYIRHLNCIYPSRIKIYFLY